MKYLDDIFINAGLTVKDDLTLTSQVGAEDRMLIVNALGVVSSQPIPTGNPGTVTSISAGTGMDFTTITSAGQVTIDTGKVPYIALGFSAGRLSWNGTGWVFDNTAYLVASDLIGLVPDSRTLTINGVAYDLSQNRSWTIDSMVYPGAGIALSTGIGWATSITDNSANWNTAYGWGNHASAGYVGGTGTINYVPKFTAAGTIGNSTIFDNGSSVGVGTALPTAGYRLDVYTTASVLRVGGTSNNVLGINKTAGNGTYPTFGGIDDPDTGIGIVSGNTGQAFIMTNGFPRIGFGSAGMFMDTNGYVGWNSTVNGAFGGGPDTAIKRDAPGVVRITNGSTTLGQLLALKVRVNQLTDAGYGLDVNSTSRFQGETYFGGAADAGAYVIQSLGGVLFRGTGDTYTSSLNASATVQIGGGTYGPALIVQSSDNVTYGKLIEIRSGINLVTEFNASGKLILYGQSTPTEAAFISVGGTDNYHGIVLSNPNNTASNNALWLKFSTSTVFSMNYVGATVFNEWGYVEADFRVEGDTLTHLLFIDTSLDAVGINNSSIHASAILDVASTTKGFLPPRLTTVQRDAVVAPATGLIVYNSTVNGIDYYNGSSWVTVGNSNSAYTTKTANYTLATADSLVKCTTNSFTITLPTAVGVTGKIYHIKVIGAISITINTTSSQTIDTAASGTIVLGNGDNMTVFSDGANWIIL